jgi:hypothetical protein
MGHWNGEHMVSSFDLAEEVLVPNLLESEVGFVVETSLRPRSEGSARLRYSQSC